MPDEVIASLVGRLSFEVDDKGLREFGRRLGEAGQESDRAKDRMGGLDRSLVKLGKNLREGTLRTLRATPKAITALGVAGATAAVAITGKLTASFIESGAALDVWAKKAGTTTQELQRIQFAGASVGAEQETVAEAFKTLQENLGELRRVGTGPAVDSLATLGLTLQDLEGRSATEQLGIFADAIQRLPTEAERVSVALEVMGEDGAALLPLFQEGSRGIDALAERADRLGVVLSDQAVQGAVEARRSLAELSATATGVGQSIAAQIAPKVTELVGRLQGWFEANREIIDQRIDEFVEGIVPAFEHAVEIGQTVVSVAGDIIDVFGGVEGAMTAAAVGVGAFTVAMGGIPGLAASVGFALGTVAAKILGVTDRIAELRDLERLSKSRAERSQRALEATSELSERVRQGRLGELSDVEYQQLIKDIESGSEGRAARISLETGEAVQQVPTALLQAAEEGRREQRGNVWNQRAQEESARRRRADALQQARGLEPEVRRRLEARAKRKGLKITPQAVETAVAAFRRSVTEGQDTATAAETAGALFDKTLGVSTSKGKKKVSTRTAEELLGGQIRALARGAGATEKATEKALEAAAKSLEGGANQKVALQSATGALERLTGQKLAAAGSPDAQLFGLLTQIGGPEAARSATAGARLVRIDQSVRIDVGGINLKIPEQFANALGQEGFAQGVEAALDIALREKVFLPITEAQQARGDRP